VVRRPTAHVDDPPRGGDVFHFRMGLFREHLGRSDPAHVDPASERCARAVREAAAANWRDYEDREGEPQGHLLSYPVDVQVELDEETPVVRLSARTKSGRFPDTRAKILGQQAKSIPNKLTT